MVTNVAVQQVLLAQNARSISMNVPARLVRTTEIVLTRRTAINATVGLPLRARTARQVFLLACNHIVNEARQTSKEQLKMARAMF